MNRLKLSLWTGALLAMGCGSGNNDFDGITFDPAVPPVLQSKSYEAIGGATLRVSADRGVLVGQQLNGATFPGGSAATASGGQITVQADGSFTYTPAAGFSGDDTTLIEVEGVSATITFRVDRRAIFVDNQAPGGGDGTQAAPFNTLSAGITAANQADDILFVFAGDGTNTNLGGGAALSVARMQFLGQGVGLSTAEGVIVEAGARPVLQDSVVVSADNVTVGGFESRDVADASGAVQFNNVTGAHVRGMRFVSQAQSAVAFTEVGGDVTVEDSQFESDTTSNEEATIHFLQTAATSNLTVSGNSFATSVEQSPRVVFADYNGSARSNFVFRNNTATGTANNRGWDSFVALDTSDTAEVDLLVENNPSLQGCYVKAFDTDSNGDSVLRTVISNSTLTTNSEPFLLEYFGPSSGSVTVRDCIFNCDNDGHITLDGSGTLGASLTNNIFRSVAQVPTEISVRHFGSSVLDLTLAGNSYSTAFLYRDGAAGAFNIRGVADLAALTSANVGLIDTAGSAAFTFLP